MADEKKQEKKEYKLLEDSFKLSSQAMQQGYRATIDGREFMIGFQNDYRGKRISQFASVCSLQESPDGKTYIPINPPVYSLNNLSERQLYELTHARVLELTGKQSKAFREHYRGYLKPVKSDED